MLAIGGMYEITKNNQYRTYGHDGLSGNVGLSDHHLLGEENLIRWDFLSLRSKQQKNGLVSFLQDIHTVIQM